MQSLWEAHTTSIHTALPIFQTELEELNSRQEQLFGYGWGNFIELISAANFVTNYTEVTQLQSYLPKRLLTSNDTPPTIPDMSKATNNVIEIMFTIAQLSGTSLWDFILSEWRTVMKNKNCQFDAQSFINDVFNHPAKEIIEFMIEIIKKCQK